MLTRAWVVNMLTLVFLAIVSSFAVGVLCVVAVTSPLVGITTAGITPSPSGGGARKGLLSRITSIFLSLGSRGGLLLLLLLLRRFEMVDKVLSGALLALEVFIKIFGDKAV